MKSLIFSLFLLMNFSLFSQEYYYTKKIEREIISLKKEGWQSLSMGILVSSTGTPTVLSYDSLKNKDVLAGFVIFNFVGAGLDIMSFTKFHKSKVLKKKLETIQRDSNPKFY